VGGTYRDPFTTNGAQLQNPGAPTRTLAPLPTRFSITGYTHSDHNPIRLRLLPPLAKSDYNAPAGRLADARGA